MGVAGYYGLFLETCRDIETFRKYNPGGGCGWLPWQYL